MALTSMPYLTIQELDANGLPYAGAKMFFYAAGTTTKQNTYSDAAGSSANTNPVVLDSAGRATVFFQPLTYDVVLAPSTDTDPPTSPIWTRSGILPVPVASADVDIPGTAGESLSAGDAVYLSDGSGGKTAGYWYKTDSDNTYSSTTANSLGFSPFAIASLASGSIRLAGQVTGLSSLTPGALYYIGATAGAIVSTAPLNARAIAVADSTTSVVVSNWIASTNNPVLSAQTTTVGNVGAGEDTLMTYTLPANMLSGTTQVLRLHAWGLTANNANAKTLRAYFGAVSFSSALTAAQVNYWDIKLEILRITSATQKVSSFIAWEGNGGTYRVVPRSNSGTEDLTSTVVLKITGDATADNDITQEGMSIVIDGKYL